MFTFLALDDNKRQGRNSQFLAGKASTVAATNSGKAQTLGALLPLQPWEINIASAPLL